MTEHFHLGNTKCLSLSPPLYMLYLFIDVFWPYLTLTSPASHCMSNVTQTISETKREASTVPCTSLVCCCDVYVVVSVVVMSVVVSV